MKVVFVRHGQTDENVAHRHQPEETPLSVLGRKQAVSAGKMLQQIQPTHIVTSPLVRAVQTASLIADQCDLIPSIDHAAAELRRPVHLTGHPHKSPRSLFFYILWYTGLARSGESYQAFRNRISANKANLEYLPNDAVVLVVSHTVFINMFLVHVCHERAMTPWRAAVTFLALFRMRNTGMTELTFTPIRNGCGWVRTADLNLE